MGKASYDRGTQVLRDRITRELDEKRPLMDNASLQQMVVELQERLKLERQQHQQQIADLRDQIREHNRQWAELKSQLTAIVDWGCRWKVQALSMFKSNEQSRRQVKKLSELLRIAGPEQVRRLRELRDMHKENQ